jgi:antitoxin PrlF
MATTVTSKGQVTIPKPIRDYLGIEPGTHVEFRRAESGEVMLEKVGAVSVKQRIDALRGHAGPGLSTDEIMLMTRGNLDDDTY